MINCYGLFGITGVWWLTMMFRPWFPEPPASESSLVRKQVMIIPNNHDISDGRTWYDAEELIIWNPCTENWPCACVG